MKRVPERIELVICQIRIVNSFKRSEVAFLTAPVAVVLLSFKIEAVVGDKGDLLNRYPVAAFFKRHGVAACQGIDHKACHCGLKAIGRYVAQNKLGPPIFAFLR